MLVSFARNVTPEIRRSGASRSARRLHRPALRKRSSDARRRARAALSRAFSPAIRAASACVLARTACLFTVSDSDSAVGGIQDGRSFFSITLTSPAEAELPLSLFLPHRSNVDKTYDFRLMGYLLHLAGGNLRLW